MWSLFCLLCFASPSDKLVHKPEAIVGIWVTEEEKSRVEIYSCGKSYCGKIIDLKEKVYSSDDSGGMGGKPKVDRENPKAELKSRPIIGMVLMSDFKFDEGQWVGGTIYDPESGKTYKCRIKLSADGKTLDVRGYIGIPALGRTSIWKKAA